MKHGSIARRVALTDRDTQSSASQLIRFRFSVEMHDTTRAYRVLRASD